MEVIPIGTGKGETKICRTQKDRLTGAAKDMVLGEASKFEG